MESLSLVYSVAEMAKLLNIGMNSAYSLVKRKDFPTIKVGKKILIPKKSLVNWLENNSISDQHL